MPRILYKYLPSERIDILLNHRIRFTPLGAFNDPFEGRPSVTALAPEAELRRMLKDVLPSEVRRAYDWLPPHVRDELTFDVFQSMNVQLAAVKEPEMVRVLSDITNDVIQVIHEKVDILVGVLSLSEVPDSLLMWSHYAASHSGFVLGFDSRHEYFDQRKTEDGKLGHLRRVQYRDSRTCGVMTGMDEADLFFF